MSRTRSGSDSGWVTSNLRSCGSHRLARALGFGADFPNGMSGMFLRHSSIGMVILVNYEHPRARKRFSYAHEYAHALLDRNLSVTVTTEGNRSDLIEVRANAFAAAFLMPEDGVNAFFVETRQRTGDAGKHGCLRHSYGERWA